MDRSRVVLSDFSRSTHGLFFQFGFGEFRFHTSLWYPEVDFHALEVNYSAGFLHRVYAHIAAFEVNKLASLRPDSIDLGPLRDAVDAEFAELWKTIVLHVWAQWRYENDLPEWRPPVLLPADAAPRAAPVSVDEGSVRHLAFVGGGKDSVVAARLLEHAGVESDAFVYANSVYGTARSQFALIDELLDHLPARDRRRLVVSDDLLDVPLEYLRPEIDVRSLTAAETPSSLFESLPLVLQHGYTRLVLGHEKSADVGNLVWSATGEEVNHQWGKSWEAERLLSAYLHDHLVENLSFFSMLKPLHDVNIFGLLREEDASTIRSTHSCNIAKPWCRRCAKCVYVWLGYLAYLDAELVDEIFGESLFDVAENEGLLRQLLGLEEQTPFECVGQVEESRLALALCAARGVGGRLLAPLLGECGIDDNELAANSKIFTEVDDAYPGLPDDLRSVLLDRLHAAADTHRAWILRTCGL